MVQNKDKDKNSKPQPPPQPPWPRNELIGGTLAGLGFILLSFASNYAMFLIIYVGVLSVGFNGGFNQAIKSNERDGVPLLCTKRENEPFSVKCDMHSWMRAYHLAIDHPWGTTTNDKGEFSLTDVPATELEFRVWHEKAGGGGGFLQRSLKIKIESGQTVTRDLEFDLSAFGL